MIGGAPQIKFTLTCLRMREYVCNRKLIKIQYTPSNARLTGRDTSKQPMTINDKKIV